MYKLLLCVRYLRTRYIALASIVSVTLGVATMIVVNSVMAGFTIEMQDRIHGILSDISFEYRSLTGMPDPEGHMRRINEVAGEYIDSMTTTVHVPAMLSFQLNGETITKPVQLIGVDAKTKGDASKFNEYLQHPTHRRGEFGFRLQEGGYDVRDYQGNDEAPLRRGMEIAGWELRRRRARWLKATKALEQSRKESAAAQANRAKTGQAEPKPKDPSTVELKSKLPPGLTPDQRRVMIAALRELLSTTNQPAKMRVSEDGSIEILPDETKRWNDFDNNDPFGVKKDPFQFPGREPVTFDPAKHQQTGCVLGIALSSYRPKDAKNEEHFLVMPGDDVQLTFPTAGTPPKAVSDSFTVVDFYESKMSEYDGAFVFVPIEKLQELRGMFERQTGKRFVTSIQIKLKDEGRGDMVRDLLRTAFAPQFYSIQTWRDKQGPLLAAVQMETMILNVLLFLIIAVAGFGILAIFFMIVVEKTKDIGILKSLGAGSGGIAGIFVTYGMSLGAVGAGAGMACGLLFVHYINQIAGWLGWLTGHEVFDPEIYYFYEIPTNVNPLTVAWIVAGALLIAVGASVLPAVRAARFHPVEALRYE